MTAVACALVATSLAAAPPEPVDAGWILSRLSRPAPMRTDFVELRTSRLLKAPLRIAGEYRRPSATVLVREVRSPYAETVTLGPDAAGVAQARIERAGKPARTYALSRAPELAAMQGGIGALLAGDRAGIETHYTLAATGTRAAWTLRMTPRTAAQAKAIASMTLHGRGAELRCIETRPAARDAPVQHTLLSTTARTAPVVMDAGTVAGLCRGRGTA